MSQRGPGTVFTLLNPQSERPKNYNTEKNTQLTIFLCQIHKNRQGVNFVGQREKKSQKPKMYY